MAFGGTSKFSTLWMKYVVSFMYDFNFGTVIASFMFLSTKVDILSVGQPFALVICLPGENWPGTFTTCILSNQ